jgi:hypothetical protein
MGKFKNDSDTADRHGNRQKYFTTVHDCLKMFNIGTQKVETSDHFKNGAELKSHTSRKVLKLNTMKTIKFALIILTLFTTITACKKETTPTSSSGTSGGGSGTTGTLKLTIFHPQRDCPPQAYTVTHTVGLGYSSTDIANDAFFDSRNGHAVGTTYTFTLNAGLYYYKGKACCTNCNSQICNGWGGFTGVGTCKSASGSVQVTAGQEVSRSITIN